MSDTAKIVLGVIAFIVLLNTCNSSSGPYCLYWDQPPPEFTSAEMARNFNAEHCVEWSS